VQSFGQFRRHRDLPTGGRRHSSSTASCASSTAPRHSRSSISRIMRGLSVSPIRRQKCPIAALDRAAAYRYQRDDRQLGRRLRQSVGQNDTWRCFGDDGRRSSASSPTYRARRRERRHPIETLMRRKGTCRDYAMLMIEAARALGSRRAFVRATSTADRTRRSRGWWQPLAGSASTAGLGVGQSSIPPTPRSEIVGSSASRSCATFIRRCRFGHLGAISFTGSFIDWTFKWTFPSMRAFPTPIEVGPEHGGILTLVIRAATRYATKRHGDADAADAQHPPCRAQGFGHAAIA